MARDYSISLDISLSMGEPFSDMLPSKLQAAKEAIAFLAQRVTVKGSRIALAIFHDRSTPVLPLTGDYRTIVKALADINFTEEGSALGDGIVESIKMLRTSRGNDKMVIVLTDGGVTGGIPVRAAALYAKYAETPLRVLVLNRKIEDSLRIELESANHPDLEIVQVEVKQKLLSEVLRLA